jgi:hypothetical protein
MGITVVETFCPSYQGTSQSSNKHYNRSKQSQKNKQTHTKVLRPNKATDGNFFNFYFFLLLFGFFFFGLVF